MGKITVHESERNKGAKGGISHMKNTYKIKAKVIGNSYLVSMDKVTETRTSALSP